MQLRDYQQECISQIIQYYTNGNTGNSLVALPTGTGKSAIIGGFIHYACTTWPGQRIMVAAHSAELIKQNSKALERLWPGAPYGLYSAELKRRETNFPISFVGIGSVVNKSEEFGHIDVLMVDECHLISDLEGSMYQKLIAKLRAVNPHLIVVGTTATPYRLKMGLITDGTIFDDIVYDLTSYDNFNKMVADGYLAPLISKRTRTEYDISSVGITAGEYNQAQLAKAVSKSDITEAAVKELIAAAQQRYCGIIFSDSIAHAEEITSILHSEGEGAGSVHSGKSKADNDYILDLHKRGRIKWLVNKDKLTTGYDHPPLDVCGMLRHTMSPGLWVQMLGRLTRPYDFNNPQQYIPGFEYTKSNALVMDFAHNTESLGPINDPKMPRKKNAKGTGDMPIRICEACGCYNHAKRVTCENCGHAFEIKPKITERASHFDVMRTPIPVVMDYTVDKVTYKKIQKAGGTPIMLVEYQVREFISSFAEVVCIEHPHNSYAHKKASDWWKQRQSIPLPTTVEDALRYQTMLRPPKRIRVHVNEIPKPKVLSAEF